eukprot:TRINITY_DN6689_c0_g2_i1.p1 TRINITY_DN6689_c0_g2~~TRINITY_DN6689_c0_g2_i1.p1  ORF type:complete len:279 (+),score=63.08 TRINITY_DN6689_c0_g2_i1:123-959(+)
MPKKKTRLPEVKGATPRTYTDRTSSWGSQYESGYSRGQSYQDPSNSHGHSASFAMSLKGSLSEEVDLSSFAGEDGEWKVPDPEDIIKEVRRCVQARKPWREDVDEEKLEAMRKADDQERKGGGGFHILLPDNRVKAMEDQLSRRLRAQLLGETEEDEAKPSAEPAMAKAAPIQPPAMNRRLPEQTRVRVQVRNPWYLPAKIWYTDKMGKDPNKVSSGGFPYDTVILKDMPQTGEIGSRGDEGLPRSLSQNEKEALEQILEKHGEQIKANGPRLPYFLR